MLIFTKVSFPHGYDDMVDYLRQEFASLSFNQAVAVVVLPKGTPFSTMNGAALTVLNADNFEDAAREIDSNYREYHSYTTAGERLYIAHMRIDRSHLNELASGRKEPNSLDAGILAKLLQTATASKTF